MFNTYAKAAESMVIIAFFFGKRCLFGFLVRDFDGGVVVLEPLVATVGIDVGVLWQRRCPAADFEIVDPAGRGLGNADDAALLRDGNFGLDGVSFLLTGIPTPLFATWPLDGLLGAVDNQGFRFRTTDPD